MHDWRAAGLANYLLAAAQYPCIAVKSIIARKPWFKYLNLNPWCPLLPMLLQFTILRGFFRRSMVLLRRFLTSTSLGLALILFGPVPSVRWCGKHFVLKCNWVEEKHVVNYSGPCKSYDCPVPSLGPEIHQNIRHPTGQSNTKFFLLQYMDSELDISMQRIQELWNSRLMWWIAISAAL